MSKEELEDLMHAVELEPMPEHGQYKQRWPHSRGLAVLPPELLRQYADAGLTIKIVNGDGWLEQ